MRSLIGFVLALCHLSFSCSCIMEYNVSEALNEFSHIFTGKVKKVECLDGSKTDAYKGRDYFCSKKVTFEPTKIIKGGEFKEIDLYTSGGGGACGYTEFPDGKEIIVFGDSWNDTLRMSICSNSSVVYPNVNELEYYENYIAINPTDIESFTMTYSDSTYNYIDFIDSASINNPRLKKKHLSQIMTRNIVRFVVKEYWKDKLSKLSEPINWKTKIKRCKNYLEKEISLAVKEDCSKLKGESFQVYSCKRSNRRYEELNRNLSKIISGNIEHIKNNVKKYEYQTMLGQSVIKGELINENTTIFSSASLKLLPEQRLFFLQNFDSNDKYHKMLVEEYFYPKNKDLQYKGDWDYYDLTNDFAYFNVICHD